MGEWQFFTILGIEPTKEQATIRDAYLKKLRLTNPEDDPEGFKQLRQAYEAALAHAAAPDDVQNSKEELDRSPSGLFVQKALKLYRTIAGRVDTKQWQELFFDPAFLDLEEEENCRRKLIAFFMNHCYLSTEVWKVIGERLQLEEEKEKLYEYFPADFVEYLLRKVRQGEDFEFDQLEGPDDVDLDEWIFLYARAGREESEKNYAAMEETLDQADALGITHPGLTFMRIRLLTQKKDPGSLQIANQLTEGLLEGDFGDALNVCYQAAEFFWHTDQKERAVVIYEKMKANMKRHYMANRRLAQWYLACGEFIKAREFVNVLLAYPLDDEVREMVDRINAGVEAILKIRIKGAPQDLRTRLDLGWCYLQQEKTKEVLELMADIVPDASLEKDYCNLMGKLYYYDKQYDRSIPLVQRWLALLEKQLPVTEEEQTEDLERIATGHSMLGSIFLDHAQNEAEPVKRDRYFQRAAMEMEKAKKANYNVGQEYGLALLYYEWGKYEIARGRCEALTKLYPDFTAAFLLQQKACVKLYDAAGVIDCYFALSHLAPDLPEPYELAAEVYYQLKRWEELGQLLDRADEKDLMTGHLKKYRFFWLTKESQTKEELTAALALAETIKQEWQDWDAAEKAGFLAECGRNQWSLGAYQKALEQIDEAIGLLPGNLMYRYIKAGILKDQERFLEALSLYLECTREYDETPHYYQNLGECYYKTGDYEKALPCLKKALDMDRRDALCCSWICRILRYYMKKENDLARLEEARPYLEDMVTLRPEAFFFIEQGLFYSAAEEFESAIDSFRQAVLADPKEPFAYSNLARIYRLTGQMDEALQAAQKSVEYLENDPAPYHLEMLGRIYDQLHEYEQALSCYERAWNRFPLQREGMLEKMTFLLCTLGRWQDALQLTEHVYGKRKKLLARKTVDIYCSCGLLTQAIKYVKYHYNEAGISAWETQQTFGRIYWYLQDGRKAYTHLQRALKSSDTADANFPQTCLLAARVCFFLGDRKKAKQLADRYFSYYEKNGGLHSHLNVLTKKPRCLSDVGEMLLYADKKQAAQNAANEIRQMKRCLECDKLYCTDGWILQACLDMAAGDFNRAVEILESLQKETPLDMDVRTKLHIAKSRLRGGMRGKHDTGN